MVTCSICFEPTQEVGEIDSCYHRFCWPCINQWADRESRCPLCKQRFKRIRRKALILDSAAEPLSKRRRANKDSTIDTTTDADSPKTPLQPGDDAPATEQTASDTADSAEEPGSPKGEIEGVVLEERKVRAKDQVYMPEDDAEDLQELVETVHCMVCGADDNDEFLLICDGCDNGYHTYCVNRRTVPLGDWYCPDCIEEHRQREEYRQLRRLERRVARQQRQQEQEVRQIPTRQAAARAAAATAPPAGGRRRLRRGASGGAPAAAAGVGHDDVDLTLLDSDVESEREGSGAGRVRRVGGAARGGTVSDLDDDDYEFELQGEGDVDDSQDSDWEGGAPPGGRRSSGARGRRAAAAAGNSSRGSGRVRGSSGSGGSGRGRQAGAGSISAEAHAAEVHRRLARSAGIAAPGAYAAAAAGRDGSRLKTWQELRAEEERNAAAAGHAPVAAGAAGSPGSRGATGRAAAAGSGKTSVQLAELLRTVNQERRVRQSQAAVAVGRDRSRNASSEDEAWAALDQARSTAAAAGGNGRSRSRAAAAACATTAAAQPGRVASGYFGSTGQQQQRTGQANSDAAGNAQQAQLRQALIARLQQQKRQRQQQQQAGRESYHAQLTDADPRDPGYMDIIRGSVAAARDKGQEDRRRRSLADAAAATGLPAGTVLVSPGESVQSRCAAAAKRIAGYNAAAGAAAARPARRPAAAQQPESRLARSVTAARQRESQQQHQQQSDSGFMDRWLNRGASSHNANRPAATAEAGNSRERAHHELPRSVRTLGAVKRGAAAQAAAVAAAGVDGGQAHMPGASQRQQRQASRQPLELQRSQQQQQQRELRGVMEGVEPGQPHSSSRYFAADWPAGLHGNQQPHTWQHQLMRSHLRAAHSQQHQAPPPPPLAPGLSGLQQRMPVVPIEQQHHAGAVLEQEQHWYGLQHGFDTMPQDSKQGLAAALAKQHLQHRLQPVNSNTSNSSGTVFPAGGAAAASGTPCSAWLPPLPAEQQPQQLAAPQQLLHSQHLPMERNPQLQTHVQSLNAKHQQQPDLCQVRPNIGQPEVVQPPPPPAAVELTYEQLKSAKSAASAIAKARLRPLFQDHKIAKDVYVHAAKEATHGIYEQVKAGGVGLQDVIAAAEAAEGLSSSSSKGVADVMKIVDALLILAGIPVA